MISSHLKKMSSNDILINLNPISFKSFLRISCLTVLSLLQALPYIRSLGESWPMTQDRSYYEAIALKEKGRWCPDHVPEVYHFDREMGVICMKYLEPPHIILRKGLIAGIEYPLLAQHMSEFMATTLFFTSLLYRTTAEHKRAGNLFSTFNFYFLYRTLDFMWITLIG